MAKASKVNQRLTDQVRTIVHGDTTRNAEVIGEHFNPKQVRELLGAVSSILDQIDTEVDNEQDPIEIECSFLYVRDFTRLREALKAFGKNWA